MEDHSAIGDYISDPLSNRRGITVAVLAAFDRRPSPQPPNIRDDTPTHRRLADLFRPHVRNYESMNLLLDWMSTYVDGCLAQARHAEQSNLDFTPQQLFLHSLPRFLRIWPIDKRIHPDIRRAMRTFDWHALWNAVFDQEEIIRFYQNNAHITSVNCRRGSARWLIFTASYAYPNDIAFSWDMQRYLEPIASMQAFHTNFQFNVRYQDPRGEDLVYSSEAMFPHWNQVFQLLASRHPEHTLDDVRSIWNVFMRQCMNVVDVCRKYFHQGEHLTPQDFATACKQASKEFLERQWRVEIDSPFRSPHCQAIPLHIRTILARTNFTALMKQLFSIIGIVMTEVGRDNLLGFSTRIIFSSLKDWARVTGHEEYINGLREARVIYIDPGHVNYPTNDVGAWLASHDDRLRGPNSDRPFQAPPTILVYDLPDDLPPAVDSDDEEFDIPADAVANNANVNAQDPRRIRRVMNRMNPFHRAQPDNQAELVDVELEAYGPLIDITTVANPCAPPEGLPCPICLEEFTPEENAEENLVQNAVENVEPNRAKDPVPKNGQKEKTETKFSKLNLVHNHNVRKAKKETEKLQPMKFQRCIHVLHRGCMQEFLSQAYPKSGLVRCPCCRADICTARPCRPVRTGFGRVPYFGRLTRP